LCQPTAQNTLFFPPFAWDMPIAPLRSWKKALEKDPAQAFPGNGIRPAFEEELHRLKVENKRLTTERDILKKALAFFAKESL
jgi:transposase